MPDAVPSSVPRPPALAESAATLAELARPLDVFYSGMGLALPPWQRVDGEDMPQPMRRLLVHQDDMTPTLEAFYGATIHIHALERQRTEDEYCRLVVLHLNGSEEPVEFGANRIRLAQFPEAARRLILEEREPLGHILRDFSLIHACQPNGFFKIASDARINGALGLSGAHVLYGRHNRLFDPHGALLSEVVEILRTPRATASA